MGWFVEKRRNKGEGVQRVRVKKEERVKEKKEGRLRHLVYEMNPKKKKKTTTSPPVE